MRPSPEKFLTLGAELFRGRTTIDRLAVAFAIGVCLALGCTYYAIATAPLISDRAAPAVTTDQQQTVVQAKAPPPAQYSLEKFAEISARPIFTPSRRPLPQKVETAALPTVKMTPPPPLIGYWTLVGVAIWPENKVAILQSAGGTTEIATIGQTVGGWKVDDIATDHIVLSYQKDRQELNLATSAVSGANAGPHPQPPNWSNTQHNTAGH